MWWWRRYRHCLYSPSHCIYPWRQVLSVHKTHNFPIAQNAIARYVIRLHQIRFIQATCSAFLTSSTTSPHGICMLPLTDFFSLYDVTFVLDRRLSSCVLQPHGPQLPAFHIDSTPVMYWYLSNNCFHAVFIFLWFAHEHTHPTLIFDFCRI